MNECSGNKTKVPEGNEERRNKDGRKSRVRRGWCGGWEVMPEGVGRDVVNSLQTLLLLVFLEASTFPGR